MARLALAYLGWKGTVQKAEDFGATCRVLFIGRNPDPPLRQLFIVLDDFQNNCMLVEHYCGPDGSGQYNTCMLRLQETVPQPVWSVDLCRQMRGRHLLWHNGVSPPLQPLLSLLRRWSSDRATWIAAVVSE